MSEKVLQKKVLVLWKVWNKIKVSKFLSSVVCQRKFGFINLASYNHSQK